MPNNLDYSDFDEMQKNEAERVRSWPQFAEWDAWGEEQAADWFGKATPEDQDRIASVMLQSARKEEKGSERRNKIKANLGQYRAIAEAAGRQPFSIKAAKDARKANAEQAKKHYEWQVKNDPKMLDLLTGKNEVIGKMDQATGGRLAVTQYLSTMTGKSLDEIDRNYEMHRDAYAVQQFGLQGDIDDGRFRSAATKEIDGRIKKREKVSETFQTAMDHVLAGGRVSELGLEGDEKEQSNRAEVRMLREFRHVIPFARQAFETLAKAEEVDVKDKVDEASFEEMAKKFTELSDADRDRFIYVLNHMAEKEGQPIDGYINKMGKSFGRTLAELPVKAQNFLNNVGSTRGDTYYDPATGKTVKDASIEFATALMQAKRSVGKVETKLEGWMGDLEQAHYDVAGSLPYMAAAMLGAPGFLSVTGAYGNDTRERLIAEGVDPTHADFISSVSAPVMSGIEKVQGNTLFKSFPALSKPLNNWFSKLGAKGALGTFAGRAAGVTLAEHAQELVQDSVPAYTQKVFHAINSDIQDVDQEVWNKAVSLRDPSTWGDKRLWLASLHFGILGAGGSTAMDAIGAKQARKMLASEDQLRLFGGMDKEQASLIASVAKAGENFKAKKLLDRFQKENTPEQIKENSDEAKADGAEARVQVDEGMSSPQFKKANDAQRDAGLPHLVEPEQEGDQYEIRQEGRASKFVDKEQVPEALHEATMETIERENDLNSEAVSEAIEMLNWSHEGANIEQVDQERTMQQDIDAGKVTFERAMQRIAIWEQANGEQVGTHTPSMMRVNGVNELKRDAVGYTAKIYRGANPLTVFEEAAEGYIKQAVAQGEIDWNWLHSTMREYEALTGEQVVGEQATEQELVEAFSDMAQAYLINERGNESIPQKVRTFLAQIKELFTAIITRAAAMKQVKDDGKLDELLEHHLATAVGLNEQMHMEMMQSEYEAQLMEELYDGVPEIKDALKWKLPRPADVKADESLSGEVQRIWDQMSKVDRKGRKQAQAASQYFAPKGSAVDLDQVRQEVNEQHGFSFATVGEMLDALDGSLAGQPYYAVGAMDGMDADFSVAPVSSDGRLQPEGKVNFIETADGRVLTDAANFSITAYHGTPHKVDKFSAEKIGTGEGNQMYGFGLYFAENKEVSEWYKEKLSAEYQKAITIMPDVSDAVLHAITSTETKAQARRVLEARLDGRRAAQAQKDIDRFNELLDTEYETLQRYDEIKEVEKLPHIGNLYQVDLKVDESELLDWDKPMSEQPHHEALLKEFYDAKGEDWQQENAGYIKGESAYLGVLGENGRARFSAETAKEKSKRMLELGIKGIRYLDGNSRRDGEGNYNYVIFDESDIQITHENDATVNYSIAPASVKIEGQDVATGTPVTFSYLHNKQSMTGMFGKPKKDDGYDRWFEPSSRFVVATTHDNLAQQMPDQYEFGQLAFSNPIVIDRGVYGDSSSWKRTLSKAYGGKRGKLLSQAIIEDGHDGVITVDENGEASEIVDFTVFEPSKANYSIEPVQITSVPEIENMPKGDLRRWALQYKSKDIDKDFRNGESGDVWNVTRTTISHTINNNRKKSHIVMSVLPQIDQIIQRAHTLGASYRKSKRDHVHSSTTAYALVELENGLHIVRMMNHLREREVEGIHIYDIKIKKIAPSETTALDSESAIPFNHKGAINNVAALENAVKELWPADFERGDGGDYSIAPELGWEQGYMTLKDLPREMREEMFNEYAIYVNPEATERDFYRKRVPMGIIKISDLEVAPIPDEQLQPFKSIDDTPPIVIADGKLVDGQHRILAARKAGKFSLRFIDVTGLTDTNEYAAGSISDLPSYSIAPASSNQKLIDAINKRLLARSPRKVEIFTKMKQEVQNIIRRHNSAMATKMLKGNVSKQDQRWMESIMDLGRLDAMLKVLPPEVRARVGGFTAVAKLKTLKGRESELKRRLTKIDRELERFLREEYQERLKEEIKRGQPKKGKNDKVAKGKITPEGHDELKEIERVLAMDKGELQKASERAQDRLQEALAKPDDGDRDAEVEAAERAVVRLTAFGGLYHKTDPRSAVDVERGWKEVQHLIDKGKLRYQLKQEQEREHKAQLRNMALKIITGGKGRLTSVDRHKQREQQAKNFLKREHARNSSFEGLLNQLSRKDKGSESYESELNGYFAKAVHKSTHAEARAIVAKEKEMIEMLADLFGIEKRGAWQARVEEVMIDQAEMTQNTKVFREENAKQKRITITRAEAEQLRVGGLEWVHNNEYGFVELTGEEIREVREMLREDDAKDKGLPKQSFTIDRKIDGKKVEQYMSQDTATFLSMMYAQEGLRPAMEAHGYTPEVMDQIDDFLTDNSKQIREWLFERYDENYEYFNATFSEQFGINLPKVENYSPARSVHAGREAQSMIDSDKVKQSTTPGMAMERIQHRAEPRNDVGALQIYKQHVDATEHFVHWAKTIEELRATFMNKDVREAIYDHHGREAYEVLINKIDMMADGGNANAVTIRAADHFRSSFTIAKLAYNWGVFLKQLTSFPAYMFDMSTSDFVRYEAEFWSNPVKNAKFMMGQDYTKHRWGEGYDRDVMLAMNSLAKKKSKLARAAQTGMSFGRAGDIIPVIVGGYAAYRNGYEKAIERGSTESQAEAAGILQFEMSTDRAQQSGNIKDQSYYQMQGSLSRVLTMFTTSPRQYYAVVTEQVLDAMAGRKNGQKKAIKAVVIGHVVLPSLFYWMSAFTRNLPKDEEDRDDVGDLIAGWSTAMAMGGANGIFLWGQGIGTMISGYEYTPPVIDWFNEIGKGGTKSRKLVEQMLDEEAESIQPEDVIAALDHFARAFSLAKGGGALWYDISTRISKSIGFDKEQMEETIFMSNAEVAVKDLKRAYKLIKEEHPAPKDLPSDGKKKIDEKRYKELIRELKLAREQYPDSWPQILELLEGEVPKKVLEQLK